MDGIAASFNPWTLLDSDDCGDCIGKAKSKDVEAKKPNGVPTWVANKAMNSSTPAKKKKPAAPPSNNPPANNGKAGPAGKQNGAPNRNGASSGSRNQSAGRQGYNGGYGAPVMKEQQQPGAAVVDAEARRPVKEPAHVPPVPTFGLWLEKSAKKAGAGGAKATNHAAGRAST